MPKIRGIKPDYWTDEDIVELTLPARLLFIGLWNYCCDNGHLQDKPKQIKMRLLPGDDVNAAELLRELAEKGRIERSDGWITVPNFTRHQKPDKRYFQTCERAGCAKPDGDSQRETRGALAGSTTSAPRAHGVGSWGPHGDGELRGSDGDGDGERRGGESAKRARQLPPSWQPNDQHKTFAGSEHLDLEAEAAQFADHHRARGTTMKDWDAAFRTWLRNAVKFSAKRGQTAQPDRRVPNAPIEAPPDGLTDEQLAAYYAERRRA